MNVLQMTYLIDSTDKNSFDYNVAAKFKLSICSAVFNLKFFNFSRVFLSLVAN